MNDSDVPFEAGRISLNIAGDLTTGLGGKASLALSSPICVMSPFVASLI